MGEFCVIIIGQLHNVRLVKLAMVDGFALHQTAVKDSWQHHLGDFLHGHLGQQQLFHNFDIASVIERAKHQHECILPRTVLQCIGFASLQTCMNSKCS